MKNNSYVHNLNGKKWMRNHTTRYKNSENSTIFIVSILIVSKELNFDVSHHDKEISDTDCKVYTKLAQNIIFSP